MQRTASQIVDRLGGTNAAARFFGVQPPSVSGWLKAGQIPRDRLLENAAELERRTCGWFSRRVEWPGRCGYIWPDLATTGEGATAAEQEVA